MFFKGRAQFQLIIAMTTLMLDISYIMGFWRINGSISWNHSFSQISPISKKCLSILIVIVINQVSNSRGKAHASDFSSLQQASTTLPIHSVFTAILLTTVSDLSTWVQDRAIMQVLYVWHPSNNEAISCWNTT